MLKMCNLSEKVSFSKVRRQKVELYTLKTSGCRSIMIKNESLS